MTVECRQLVPHLDKKKSIYILKVERSPKSAPNRAKKKNVTRTKWITGQKHPGREKNSALAKNLERKLPLDKRREPLKKLIRATVHCKKALRVGKKITANERSAGPPVIADNRN